MESTVSPSLRSSSFFSLKVLDHAGQQPRELLALGDKAVRVLSAEEMVLENVK